MAENGQETDLLTKYTRHMANAHYIPADFDPKLGEFNQKKCYLVQHFDENNRLTDSYWIKNGDEYRKFVTQNKLPLPVKNGYKRHHIQDGWLMDIV